MKFCELLFLAIILTSFPSFSFDFDRSPQSFQSDFSYLSRDEILNSFFHPPADSQSREALLSQAVHLVLVYPGDAAVIQRLGEFYRSHDEHAYFESFISAALHTRVGRQELLLIAIEADLSPVERCNAGRVLLKLPEGQEMIDTLTQGLARSADENSYELAVCLIREGTFFDMTALAQQVLRSSDAGDRGAAIDYLGRYEKVVSGTLLRQASQETNPDNLSAIIYASGKDPRVRRRIVGRLQNEKNPELRSNIVSALTAFDDPSIYRILAERFNLESNPLVRAKIFSVMVSGLSSNDEKVITIASGWLKALGVRDTSCN